MADHFIDRLASVIYTEANIEAAKQYAIGRGINPTQWQHLWTLTSPDLAPFDIFKNKYPPIIFPESLYIPIAEMHDPTQLAGFDVRFCGETKTVNRTRYHKFKRAPESVMVYRVEDAIHLPIDKTIIITEGVLDCESIRMIGFSNVAVISPLTALSSLNFTLFLTALSNRIIIAYDKDDDGRRATQKIMDHMQSDPDNLTDFQILDYKGHDPNQCLKDFGKNYLRQCIENQL
ncbi:MAG TPA: toprim domain-containing protein [bacterium]|nr:toprim domain-containing protein [bacterium]